MFIRVKGSVQRGQTYEYLQLVESYREAGYVRQRVRATLGRLKAHASRDKHAGKWDRFVIYRIKQVRYLKDIETLLIGVLRPPGNSVEERAPRDADINRILRRVLTQQVRGDVVSFIAFVLLGQRSLAGRLWGWTD